jgi:hypothetical protein
MRQRFGIHLDVSADATPPSGRNERLPSVCQARLALHPYPPPMRKDNTVDSYDKRIPSLSALLPCGGHFSPDRELFPRARGKCERILKFA